MFQVLQVDPSLYTVYICRYSLSNLQASALLLPKGHCVSDERDVELGRYWRGFGEIWSRSFRVQPYFFTCHRQDNLQKTNTNTMGTNVIV